MSRRALRVLVDPIRSLTESLVVQGDHLTTHGPEGMGKVIARVEAGATRIDTSQLPLVVPEEAFGVFSQPVVSFVFGEGGHLVASVARLGVLEGEKANGNGVMHQIGHRFRRLRLRQRFAGQRRNGSSWLLVRRRLAENSLTRPINGREKLQLGRGRVLLVLPLARRGFVRGVRRGRFHRADLSTGQRSDVRRVATAGRVERTVLSLARRCLRR